MAKLKLKRRMKNLLMFMPNLVALCGRLMTDRRVPAADKALFAGAILYAVMPFDFIPDMIPFVGQVDDAYLISLALLRLIRHTNADVVRDNWRGGGDVVELAEAIVGLAPKFLPKRILRVLSAKVETVPEDLDGLIRAVRKSEPLLVASPGEEELKPAAS
ncbi:MAG TPA: DUF1232 domain-containing protein [Pyrinomonadaceae bacterium]|nr:DUF1232 domain-containing protein [Pyrinomonadaceae bacterium]